jgi:hypothetical protein
MPQSKRHICSPSLGRKTPFLHLICGQRTLSLPSVSTSALLLVTGRALFNINL